MTVLGRYAAYPARPPSTVHHIEDDKVLTREFVSATAVEALSAQLWVVAQDTIARDETLHF